MAVAAPKKKRLYGTWTPLTGPLTTRELRIIELVVAGCRNKEISVKLGCSDETVKKHLFNIFNKTGTESRLQLGLKYCPSREPNTAAISRLCDRVEALLKQIRILNGEIK